MELSEKEKYDYLFTLADSDQDGVIGLKDAAFLNKSGLSRSLLGQVC
jgi:Ca2+-binding EF-hand superfamily protein